MALPTEFCWTRFGTEAGETVAAIFSRKEQERNANNGVFLWGIGNAIGPSLSDFLKRTPSPAVIFSPMRSKPARKDVEPAATAYWTAAVGLDGRDYTLPEFSLVTSSFDPRRRTQARYALVCHSSVPISEPMGASYVRHGELRNWKSGATVGSSQVTCIVRRVSDDHPPGPEYRAALVATLCPPYLLRLASPRPIPEELRLDRLSGDDWTRAIRSLLSSRPSDRQQFVPFGEHIENVA